jgi:F-type H+-transporting ATPase subunit epsilon|tara:strand:+ start:397 stop:828 length:432 start_codon:yes stop_codon:yes gene_type:complete
MATTVQCDIVSSEKSLFSGLVELVVATGSQGELGIAFGHAPLLTNLKPGPVRVIKEGGEEEIYYLSGGFLEIQPNVISILADTALRADDLDEAAATTAKNKAEEAISNQSGDFDYSKAASQLAVAAAQLRTIDQIRKKLGSKK